MGLSDNCQNMLCDIAVVGGAITATALGVNVATGVVELVSGGGKLALAVSREQQDRCEKLLRNVKKRVARDVDGWIRSEFRDTEAARADIEAAFDELDRLLPTIKPTPAEAVEASFNAETLYQRISARVPGDSLLRTNPNAAKVFRAVITGTYTLVRSDPAFSATLTSFGFERLFANLEAMDGKLDQLTRGQLEIKLDLKRNHEEQMQAHARRLGAQPEDLRPLFDAVERDVPEASFGPAIKEAVEALKARAANPVPLLNDPEEIRRAIEIARERLGHLDTDGAIDHLRKVRAEQAEIRQERQRGEARLAKEEAEILKIVYRWDEAIAAFQAAADLDPSDCRPWFEIGDIRTFRGNLEGALANYQKGMETAKATGNQRDLSVSHTKIGDIRTAQGNLAAALEAYQAGLDIADALAKADPNNTEWQRDLSVSHNKIGDIRTAQGNLAAALEAYQAGLDIADALAKADPNNTQWQRDLSVSHNRIGDIRTAQGNLTATLEAYQADLDIADALAKADPNNTEWQRDLSVSHEKIGNIRTAQGDLAGALEAYQAALDIRDTLAKADPNNTEWQRDLSVSHDRIGNIRTAQGNLTAALEAYQAGLDIRNTLAKADPNNTQWQRDLSVSHNKIGDIRTAQGNLTAALEAYQAGLDIADTLARADPNNTEWQRDLSVSHEKIGNIRTAQGDLAGALEAYQAALDIRDTLAKTDPHNTEWQRDLSVSHNKIGDIRTAQGNLAAALESYQSGLDIRTALAKADPNNTQWQRDLSVSHERIGDIRTAQGNLAAALESYQSGLDIRTALAKADPNNTQWQRDLIVSHWRIAAAGFDPVDHYEQALEISRLLAAEGKLAPVDEYFIPELEKLITQVAK
ncbi:hypothetical protein [Hoeflea sp.]|uniref:hypothetical protein n=1 Tax=Hoeflea sp. TaxID=1940281 RepID=UPI003749DD48